MANFVAVLCWHSPGKTLFLATTFLPPVLVGNLFFSIWYVHERRCPSPALHMWWDAVSGFSPFRAPGQGTTYFRAEQRQEQGLFDRPLCGSKLWSQLVLQMSSVVYEYQLWHLKNISDPQCMWVREVPHTVPSTSKTCQIYHIYADHLCRSQCFLHMVEPQWVRYAQGSCALHLGIPLTLTG